MSERYDNDDHDDRDHDDEEDGDATAPRAPRRRNESCRNETDVCAPVGPSRTSREAARFTGYTSASLSRALADSRAVE